MFQRKIDRDASDRRYGALPISKILADLVQHPFTKLNNQIGLLGDGNKVGRQYQPTIGKLPANERLGAENFPSLQVVLGLVVHTQLVSFERSLEFAFGHEAFDCRLVHLRFVIMKDIATRLFGAVQSGIGITYEVDDVGRILRVIGYA